MPRDVTLIDKSRLELMETLPPIARRPNAALVVMFEALNSVESEELIDMFELFSYRPTAVVCFLALGLNAEEINSEFASILTFEDLI